MRKLTKCCCCCSLETGCKVIAIFGLIIGVLEMINVFRGDVTTNPNASDILTIVTSILGLVASALLLWGTM